ncbi:hypothetical protein Pmani_039358 [Petrolisthes manimaculis]|uniref:Uncharacterized protein n=1 Tax=Petrolisthes manimaculis TaxID=1843537 RepID=A0AAE1TJM5_9EUCA|nr:hypothetical protein Pmani_039358 [Petrolisthes manimaculis]
MGDTTEQRRVVRMDKERGKKRREKMGMEGEGKDLTNNPIHDSTNNPIHDSTNNPIHDSTSNPIHDSTNNPIHESTNDPIHESTNNPIPPGPSKVTTMNALKANTPGSSPARHSGHLSMLVGGWNNLQTGLDTTQETD